MTAPYLVLLAGPAALLLWDVVGWLVERGARWALR